MCVCVCARPCEHTQTRQDVCSPQEVEVKDHQLNNEPGGEIKDKTSRSSNCYPKRARLKLRGVGSEVFAAAARKHLRLWETNMLQHSGNISFAKDQ